MGTMAALGVGGGPVSTFVPTDIAGLVLWLDADNIAQADNTTVATWNDASGAGNNAAGASGQTLQTVELNGHSIVRFDGVDDFMSVAGITNNDATRTIFAVMKTVSLTSGDACFGWANGAACTQSGTVVRWSLNQAAGQQTIGTPGTSVHHIYTIRFTSTSSADVYFDAGAATNFDPDDSYQSGAAVLNIGARNAGTAPANIDLAALLIYNSTLSDPDRLSVLGYLQARFGL
jgi:hypothetical protein